MKKKASPSPLAGQPRKRPIDLDLPPFREAIPTPEAMNSEGAKALANALLLITAKDYYEQWPNPSKELEHFIDGDLFESITDIIPEYFRKKVSQLKESGKRFPISSELRHAGEGQTIGVPVIYSRDARRDHKMFRY